MQSSAIPQITHNNIQICWLEQIQSQTKPTCLILSALYSSYDGARSDC